MTDNPYCLPTSPSQSRTHVAACDLPPFQRDIVISTSPCKRYPRRLPGRVQYAVLDGGGVTHQDAPRRMAPLAVTDDLATEFGCISELARQSSIVRDRFLRLSSR